MGRQLTLMETPRTWRIDPATKAAARKGLAEARARLAEGKAAAARRAAEAADRARTGRTAA